MWDTVAKSPDSPSPVVRLPCRARANKWNDPLLPRILVQKWELLAATRHRTRGVRRRFSRVLGVEGPPN